MISHSTGTKRNVKYVFTGIYHSHSPSDITNLLKNDV